MIPSNSTSKRPLALFAILLSTGAVSGCKHEVRTAPAPPDVVLQAPPDQLDDSEVLETTEEAFGLSLPEGMAVTKRLYGNVVLVGTRPMNDVVGYLRTHVDAIVQNGVETTSFTSVTVKKPRSEWRGNLRIDVARQGETTRVELWGEEPPPLPANTGRVLPDWVQTGKPPPRAPRDR